MKRKKVKKHCSKTVAYQRKMASMAKFKYASIKIILILDIDTIFTKIKYEENKCFKTENMCLFLIKTFQQIKYSINYPQARTTAYFYNHLFLLQTISKRKVITLS